MRDLDKAIRDRLAVVRGHMTMHRAAQIDDSVDPLFNDAGELGATIVALLDEHKPYGIYTECGHRHELTENGGFPDGVIDVDDVGLTCAKGLEYWICEACCGTSDYGQPERCASEHDHHVYDGGGTYCLVVSTIAFSLGVSGEDRSDPKPAPREYRAGDTEPPVGTKLTGGGFTWTRHGRSWQTPEGGVLTWAQLTEFCPRLSEVVTPEGTP